MTVASDITLILMGAVPATISAIGSVIGIILTTQNGRAGRERGKEVARKTDAIAKSVDGLLEQRVADASAIGHNQGVADEKAEQAARESLPGDSP